MLIAELFGLFEAGSAPPLITAVLLKPGTAIAPTPTVSVIGLLDMPAGMTVLDVHVNTCIMALQIQPVPVADIKVKPAGSVSLMVMTPNVAAVPRTLRGVKVNTPFTPTTNVPLLVLDSVKSGAKTMVGSTAVLLPKSLSVPALDTVAELLTKVVCAFTFTVNVMSG
jgi:hypothetical protein